MIRNKWSLTYSDVSDYSQYPMKNFLLILTSALTLSCSTYSPDELNGKWESTIEGDNIELWIQDTLAIGFNINNQLMNTYKVDYNGRMLTFTFIDHMEGSASLNEKILYLTETELSTELQNPRNKQISSYRRTSKEAPKISTDYEMNWERYEKYMKGKSMN